VEHPAKTLVLPEATPPNAIIFASRHVTIGQMVRAGCWLNLIGVVLIVLFTYTLGTDVLEAQANRPGEIRSDSAVRERTASQTDR